MSVKSSKAIIAGIHDSTIVANWCGDQIQSRKWEEASLRPIPLFDQIYRQVRDDILAGRLKPGAEAAVVARVGCPPRRLAHHHSRGLDQLRAEGLHRIAARDSVRVSRQLPEDARRRAPVCQNRTGAPPRSPAATPCKGFRDGRIRANTARRSLPDRRARARCVSVQTMGTTFRGGLAQDAARTAELSSGRRLSAASPGDRRYLGAERGVPAMRSR